MNANSEVRIGLAGVGGMGSNHARNLRDGKIRGASLAAVCDIHEAALAKFDGLPQFTEGAAMFGSGEIDAVLIATPHYDHVRLGIQALQAGLHTLVEKPIAVHKADAERLITAHTDPTRVFSAMFNQRLDPFWIKIRHLVRSGELGAIRRINWIITDWFRSDAYYASGGWRATWKGEGGGVLLNQCPHNLDLWQWMFGMPEAVWADCRLGQYHAIEVEDEVTAYMRYADGATGVLITSTGEAPGTNRLEVAGDRGRLVYEGGTLHWTRNEVPTSEHCRTSRKAFGPPPVWEIDFPLDPKNHGKQHIGILQNFVDAIQEGEPLVAPAQEGIHSVELANAMLLSSARGSWVSLPMVADEYEALLNERIAGSSGVNPLVANAPKRERDEDFAKSFTP